jgi:YHS domain-containing protein/thioredoxin-related protein
MRRSLVVIVLGMMIGNLPVTTLASVPWLSDVRQAQQIAHQQQRLVLLHFYANWCGPCIRLDREVYPRPDISSAISSNYVPVKIDLRRSPELARQYQVQSFPTDVILDPSGRVLYRTTTPADPSQYLQMLNHLATNRNPPQQPQTSPAHPTGIAQAWPPSSGNQMIPHQVDNQAWQPHHSSGAHPVHPTGASSGYPPQAAHTPDPSQSAHLHRTAHVAPEAPLALDGFCPVTLTQQNAWHMGNLNWGAVHRGRTYLFVSQTHQEQFLADPDRYSPVLSGYDPTRFIDQGEPVPGKREYGMRFRGRIYLFAEEATLERFQRSPEHYAQRSHEIMMRGARR